MPASSLIFVVIVAIWAAYLLQHWVRRRENAAATRSVDGFTEAMRVLEKRPILPRAELDTPRPRSYSVVPGRRARPTVDVKRAVPAGAPRHSPLVARRRAEADPVEVEAMSPAAARPAPHERLDRHTDRPSPDDHHTGRHTGRHTDRQPDRPAGPAPAPRYSSTVAQRRLRAALLLIAFLWVPVSTVLAATGRLLWVSVPFSVLTVVAVLVWLRIEARADRARAALQRGSTREAGFGAPMRRVRNSARDTARRTARRLASRPVPELTSDDTQVIRHPDRYAVDPTAEPATPAAPAAEPTTAPDVATAPAASAAQPATTAASVGAEASPAAYDTVFDAQAGEPAAPSEPSTPAAQPADGTWSPVPVPTPTYVMKAKAEPRLTVDGIPADVFDTPEFAEEADELDDRALFARRAASQ